MHYLRICVHCNDYAMLIKTHILVHDHQCYYTTPIQYVYDMTVFIMLCVT